MAAGMYNRADAPRVLQVIRKAGPLLDKFITHSFANDLLTDAWRRSSCNSRGECGKVIAEALAMKPDQLPASLLRSCYNRHMPLP